MSRKGRTRTHERHGHESRTTSSLPIGETRTILVKEGKGRNWSRKDCPVATVTGNAKNCQDGILLEMVTSSKHKFYYCERHTKCHDAGLTHSGNIKVLYEIEIPHKFNRGDRVVVLGSDEDGLVGGLVAIEDYLAPMPSSYAN